MSLPRAPLSRRDLDPDPIVEFGLWLDAAVAAGVDEPTAMVLSTVGPEGRPSARAVLLKGHDHRGFVFFTNKRSRKGREIAENPAVALTFVWPAIHRQIRIEGIASEVTDVESDAYFVTRPAGARIGAAASPQSEVIPDRAWLERRMEELRARYPDGDIPRPEHWGGYRVAPETIEFWQGREDRVHDRFRYRRSGSDWILERLAP